MAACTRLTAALAFSARPGVRTKQVVPQDPVVTVERLGPDAIAQGSLVLPPEGKDRREFLVPSTTGGVPDLTPDIKQVRQLLSRALLLGHARHHREETVEGGDARPQPRALSWRLVRVTTSSAPPGSEMEAP